MSHALGAMKAIDVYEPPSAEPLRNPVCLTRHSATALKSWPLAAIAAVFFILFFRLLSETLELRWIKSSPLLRQSIRRFFRDSY